MNIPMVCYQNHELLNHPHIQRICKIDRELQKHCNMCDNPGNPDFLCMQCKGAQYCSWACKVDDQQHHALVCNQWANFALEAERPTKNSARILIFPARDATPVFSWADMIWFADEESPRLRVSHPEFKPFRDETVSRWVEEFTKVSRIGCINTCRAIAARRSLLGHGLFVLEWMLTPPPASDAPAPNVDPGWINQSIQTIATTPSPTAASLVAATKPGHTWLWTGPIMVISLDLSRTSTKAEHRFVLDDVDLRDFRHAVDFFSLNLRNPCLPFPIPTYLSPPKLIADPSAVDCALAIAYNPALAAEYRQPDGGAIPLRGLVSALSTPGDDRQNAPPPREAGASAASRFPFDILPAVKLNEPGAPVFRALDVDAVPLMEEVCVSRDLPPPAAEIFQGVSALCAQLGLAWVVRAVLGHGPELDHLYDEGCLPTDLDGGTESGKADAVIEIVAGDDDQPPQRGSVIPSQLDDVLWLDSKTRMLRQRKLPRSGDGMVIFHGAGGKLWLEHVQALLQFISETEQRVGQGEQVEYTAEEFGLFWRQFRTDPGLPPDVPSPYDLMPAVDGVDEGAEPVVKFLLKSTPKVKFQVCREVFTYLVEDNATLV